jgi:hypothetical protein
MMLLDKEFYVLCRDELYKECIWDKSAYVRRLVLHDKKKDIEHFLCKGFLSRESTPERKGVYDDICCCLLRHKKIEKSMVEYLLSSDIHLTTSCDTCYSRKMYGIDDNVRFLLNYIRKEVN